MSEDNITIDECEECLDRLAEVVETAAALTTKQRQKMRSTTFCGPGRSFPVPNCKYVGVARAYLNRSKFSRSTKQRIAACINKKAKAMKCGDKSNASEEVVDLNNYTYAKLSKEEQKLYNSDDFKSTKELVKKSIDKPGTI